MGFNIVRGKQNLSLVIVFHLQQEKISGEKKEKKRKEKENQDHATFTVKGEKWKLGPKELGKCIVYIHHCDTLWQTDLMFYVTID